MRAPGSTVLIASVARMTLNTLKPMYTPTTAMKGTTAPRRPNCARDWTICGNPMRGPWLAWKAEGADADTDQDRQHRAQHAQAQGRPGETGDQGGEYEIAGEPERPLVPDLRWRCAARSRWSAPRSSGAVLGCTGVVHVNASSEREGAAPGGVRWRSRVADQAGGMSQEMGRWSGMPRLVVVVMAPTQPRGSGKHRTKQILGSGIWQHARPQPVGRPPSGLRSRAGRGRP